jgi:hypothetical protein
VRLGVGYLREDRYGSARLIGVAGGQLVDVVQAAEIDLRRKGATCARAAQLAAAAFPASLTGVLGGGAAVTDWLRRLLDPGDVVEMSVAGIGTLRNRIGPRAGPAYLPRPRHARAPAGPDSEAGG